MTTSANQHFGRPGTLPDYPSRAAVVWRACVNRVAHPVHLERVGGARDTIESAVRPATIGDAEEFQIAPGATCFAPERLRMLDELPVALDFTLVPVALDSLLPGLDWGVASLCAALGSAGHRPVAADYSVEAHPADDRSARLLGAAVGTPLLVADSRTYTPDGPLIVFDSDLWLRVSPQLRSHGWNGIEFYEREAAGYRIPAPSYPNHRPDRDALAWQFETKIRAA